ncbi:hypothetical protein SBOR_9842 [Sclerotinia borealis F-4128]|uniref:Uncharacterized protein n=1 Tax=Sclerotinia borealis (strain F-4128) TaxID=1432307 RepID=W9C5C9_SCLBF|nr:hypothetical protein SBOR_9842 [Sclerotinia borealis F-4128]
MKNIFITVCCLLAGITIATSNGLPEVPTEDWCGRPGQACKRAPLAEAVEAVEPWCGRTGQACKRTPINEAEPDEAWCGRTGQYRHASEPQSLRLKLMNLGADALDKHAASTSGQLESLGPQDPPSNPILLRSTTRISRRHMRGSCRG